MHRLPAPTAHGRRVSVGGRVGRAVEFDGSAFIDAGDAGRFGFYDKFTPAAWVFPNGARGG